MLSVAARRRLGGFLLDVAFDAPTGTITALFGASGAGKSATLAVIAGTLVPDTGRVVLDDRVLTDTATRGRVPPERRRIGVVHQDARLFPHMNVARNLRYGWRRATGEHRIGWDEVIEVLAIAHLLDRRPHDLSGGERQRVALGRAMLSQPALLLLDEPVSALDAARRDEVLAFISSLHARFALPMVYVTHAADEVHRIAGHVVRLADGRVVASGPPAEVLPRRSAAGEIVIGADGQPGVRLTGAAPDLSAGTRVEVRW